MLSQAESVPGAPLSLVGKTSLMATPGTDPSQVAQNLRDAVGSSGLFYESHVAEWADGKRPLASLLLEPQMQKTLQGEVMKNGTDLAAAQLINLQLHTHEQARVQWQGEAWPGQKMQWDITKDEPEGGQHPGQDEDATAWRSSVRFQFPLLGDLSAQVVLQGGKVQIQMQAGSEASAETLRQHAARLEASMEAAGWPLSSLTIAGKAGVETTMLDDGKRKMPQTAVALAYQSGAAAPKVVAKGSGLIADKIISTAREHGVFVHESKELVALLMDIDLDSQIPPGLYRAIAELLAWLYHIESAKGGPLPPPPDTLAALPTDT